jgi:hypothetical protein
MPPTKRPAANAATRKVSETGNLSLKDFLNAQQNTALAFTGDTTAKGNPVFTNSVESYPIAIGLLKYYVKEGVVELDDDDNIVCDKGWRVKDGTWQPKARVNDEL